MINNLCGKNNFFIINFNLSYALKASSFSQKPHIGIDFTVANGVRITGINTQHVTYGPGHLDRCQQFRTARPYFSCSTGLKPGRQEERSISSNESVMSRCAYIMDARRRDVSRPGSIFHSQIIKRIQTQAHKHPRTYTHTQNTQKLHQSPRRPTGVLSTILSPLTIQFTRCCLQQAISRIGVPVNHGCWKISCLPVISGLEASWPKG